MPMQEQEKKPHSRFPRFVLFFLIAFCFIVFLVFFIMATDFGKPHLTPSVFQGLTIYDVDGFDSNSISADQLEMTTHVKIDPAVMKEIFAQNVWHRSTFGLLWMGSWLGVVTLEDGNECRIEISYSSGFFTIQGQKGYFQTEGKSREELDQLLESILTSEFIPARMRQIKERSSLPGPVALTRQSRLVDPTTPHPEPFIRSVIL